jgi:DNA invertase Pin-like site-specific DNA recombinase
MSRNYKAMIAKSAAVGYSRVSTARQAELGNSRLEQDASIRDFCRERGIRLLGIHGEAATGMVEREGDLDEDLRGAIDESARAEAMIVVTDISRLGRSHAVLSYLDRCGVPVASVRDGGLLPREELEAKLSEAAQEGARIRRNAKDGIRSAKGRGVQLGNTKNLAFAQKRAAITRRSNAEALTEAIEEILRPHELTRRLTAAEAAQILNGHGLRTARGGHWTKHNVRRHLRKARRLRSDEEEEEGDSRPVDLLYKT